MGTSSGGPGPGARDFIVVDDGGSFGYAASEAELLSQLEYPEEAACVVDRSGNNFDLEEVPDGGLRLAPSIGRADLEWLRRVWHTAQQRNPADYPLVRPLPDSDEGFLRELFAVLRLSSGGPDAAAHLGGFWVVNDGGSTSSTASLNDMLELLAGQRHTESTSVEGPDRRRYRVERERRRGPLGVLRPGRPYLVQTWPV
ncbi:hypothetical protein KIH31_02045 [Paenarthrobacter sp. DKR-5]|uniref:hypothetical protein n=1 Tax=Paenarthrobacter sp. DKR-5 TaxID=2835535 RepID=UPI001BDD7BAA|nr:hypothetical protein [Paenarthrobacter sp. DKR-5]MBT1001372.1 hypothetical protein [Paenarthrobacter sp. DKR-5]